MQHVHHTFSVASSPERVYGLLTDFNRRPEWLPLRVAEQTTPSPVRVGTGFREVNRILGRDTEVRFVVLEALPPERLVYRSEGNGRFVAEVSWTVTRTASGASVAISVALELRGFGKLFGIFGAGPLRSQVLRDTARLSQLLVQEPAGRPVGPESRP